MLNLFSSIINTISAVIFFVIHTITSLFHLLVHVPVYVEFLIESINVLPGIIIPFAIASITLGAALFMLGR